MADLATDTTVNHEVDLRLNSEQITKALESAPESIQNFLKKSEDWAHVGSDSDLLYSSKAKIKLITHAKRDMLANAMNDLNSGKLTGFKEALESAGIKEISFDMSTQKTDIVFKEYMTAINRYCKECLTPGLLDDGGKLGREFTAVRVRLSHALGDMVTAQDIVTDKMEAEGNADQEKLAALNTRNTELGQAQDKLLGEASTLPKILAERFSDPKELIKAHGISNFEKEGLKNIQLNPEDLTELSSSFREKGSALANDISTQENLAKVLNDNNKLRAFEKTLAEINTNHNTIFRTQPKEINSKNYPLLLHVRTKIENIDKYFSSETTLAIATQKQIAEETNKLNEDFAQLSQQREEIVSQIELAENQVNEEVNRRVLAATSHIRDGIIQKREAVQILAANAANAKFSALGPPSANALIEKIGNTQRTANNPQEMRVVNPGQQSEHLIAGGFAKDPRIVTIKASYRKPKQSGELSDARKTTAVLRERLKQEQLRQELGGLRTGRSVQGGSSPQQLSRDEQITVNLENQVEHAKLRQELLRINNGTSTLSLEKQLELKKIEVKMARADERISGSEADTVENQGDLENNKEYRDSEKTANNGAWLRGIIRNGKRTLGELTGAAKEGRELKRELKKY